MPVPKELAPLFSKLVEKSRKGEINWRTTDSPDAFRVEFGGIAIHVAQDADRRISIQLLNDQGGAAAEISVDFGEEEWLGAVSLVNSANRKVSKIDSTMRRALEELAKDGMIGEGD